MISVNADLMNKAQIEIDACINKVQTIETEITKFLDKTKKDSVSQFNHEMAKLQIYVENM